MNNDWDPRLVELLPDINDEQLRRLLRRRRPGYSEDYPLLRDDGTVLGKWEGKPLYLRLLDASPEQQETFLAVCRRQYTEDVNGKTRTYIEPHLWEGFEYMVDEGLLIDGNIPVILPDGQIDLWSPKGNRNEIKQEARSYLSLFPLLSVVMTAMGALLGDEFSTELRAAGNSLERSEDSTD